MSRLNPGRTRGISLIELLIAVAIGLVVTLVVTGMLVRSEASKRSTTSVNDINQTGTFAAYVLDRAMRSAGSGYAQRWQDVFGCVVQASRNNTAILPRPSALPAPFESLPQQVRLAPLVIHKSASAGGSDVLAVMSGSAGFGETPSRALITSVTTNSLRLPNTLGLRGDDLVLLAESPLGCMLQQVRTGFVGSDDQALPFQGAYYSQSAGGGQLTSYGTSADLFVIQIGNAVNGNAPHFQMYGVGANNTLFSYDLLQLGVADAATPLADGIVEMRGLYGVDSNGDSIVDTWTDPGVAPYTAAALLDGSTSARDRLRTIMAVRIGLVLRTSLAERGSDYQAPATVTLFPDMPQALRQTRALSDDERRFRHRTVELTVPLRNLLLL